MEVWFYHLQRRSLDETLPALIEKSLERGWRVVVQGTSEARVAALDQHLWTYADDSFLAHGRAGDGDFDLEPVYLTTGDENPNGARLRILFEGAEIAASLSGGPYERVLLIFDGADAAQLSAARAQWKKLKDGGFAVSYWAQDDGGRWEKKA
ncbi:DNA polymerase III subunit chi [Methylocella sp.]|uniref:DNA polymerase III subunit chi n=1 Tax=Methylocella sp. TaxID=1978226 RepID=UPI003784A0B3